MELELLISSTGDVAAEPCRFVGRRSSHYTSLEQSAGRLQTFEPIAVPGLLQTEDYALAAVQASHLPVTQEVASERVRARMTRQAVLDREPGPLHLACVIDESVLHRSTGGPEVMAGQLGHLVTAAARPSIEIRIIRAESEALHCAAFGAFRLFSAGAASRPFVACREDLIGVTYLDRRHEIEAHTQLFEHLAGVALSPSESIHLVETIAENYQ